MLQKGWKCDYSILEKHGNQKIILSISPFFILKKGWENRRRRTASWCLGSGLATLHAWKDSQTLNKHTGSVLLSFPEIFAAKWTYTEKANTASAWAIPVLQINKGVNFLVLSDYCLFLCTRLFKNSQCKRRKIYCKAEFIYLPICKSWCIDLWIQWIKLSRDFWLE